MRRGGVRQCPQCTTAKHDSLQLGAFESVLMYIKYSQAWLWRAAARRLQLKRPPIRLQNCEVHRVLNYNYSNAEHLAMSHAKVK
jgi:hypothetical protein